MKPFIRIDVAGGVVHRVESNLPGTEVMVYDVDAESAGEDPRTTLEAFFPPGGMEVPNTGRLTDAEMDRFEREMEGNLDGDTTTQAVLLHIISDSPQACALFRAWLTEAEKHSYNALRGVATAEFGLTFYSAKGSVLQTAFCFDTIEEAEEAAQKVFFHGNPDCLTAAGISWDPLYAWDQPITGASVETEEDDVKDIPRPEPQPQNPGPLTTAEYALAASGGVPVTDDELIDTPNGRVHPDFGYVDGPEPEPDDPEPNADRFEQDDQ